MNKLIPKSNELYWDENKVGIRNGWAISQAVQIVGQYGAEEIKKWTQWFLDYSNELRDKQADAYNALGRTNSGEYGVHTAQSKIEALHRARDKKAPMNSLDIEPTKEQKAD